MSLSELIHIPSGEIIATDVSAEEYEEKYASHFCEWVNGTVIKMSPVKEKHDKLSRYFAKLLEAYFELRPIGQIRQAPFLMRLSDRRREPDLQIILDTNPNELTDSGMNGPADICIEIVSLDSIQRDHGEKFEEYEKGGVSQYWIVDPLRYESRFYRRNADGIFIRQETDADGNYRTPLLPGLVLHVPTLWDDDLPGPGATSRAVEAMLSHEY